MVDEGKSDAGVLSVEEQFAEGLLPVSSLQTCDEKDTYLRALDVVLSETDDPVVLDRRSKARIAIARALNDFQYNVFTAW